MIIIQHRLGHNNVGITRPSEIERNRKCCYYCFVLFLFNGLSVSLLEPETDAEPKCCDKAPADRHPACWPIEIPSDDPFYSNFGRRCMEFVRSATGLSENCKLGIYQMNKLKQTNKQTKQKMSKNC